MISRRAEMEIKENRLRILMEEKGLNAILLKKQANFAWFTGGGLNMVGTATEMGVASLLITRTGRYLIASNIEAPRMMVEEGLTELGFEMLTHNWYEAGEAVLVRSLIGGDLSKVGSDFDLEGCPNVEDGLRKLRYSLTENEVERYLNLGIKMSVAIEKVMLGVRPGDKECEIAGRLAKELWADRIDPTGFNIAADERAYQYRHPIPTEAMVRRQLVVSVNARFKGLIASVTRMLHFGRPSEKLSRQFADNLVIEGRMIAATRQGQPFAAAIRAGMDAYRDLGYGDEWRYHHQGGPAGYYARDFRVTETSNEVVAENQAVFWNPTISGTKTEDGFIVTGDGPQLITSPVVFPKEMINAGGLSLIRAGILVVD